MTMGGYPRDVQAGQQATATLAPDDAGGIETARESSSPDGATPAPSCATETR
jgi:hypothetical protein